MIEQRGGQWLWGFVELAIRRNIGSELLRLEFVSAGGVVPAKASDQSSGDAMMLFRGEGDVALLMFERQVGAGLCKHDIHSMPAIQVGEEGR